MSQELWRWRVRMVIDVSASVRTHLSFVFGLKERKKCGTFANWFNRRNIEGLDVLYGTNIIHIDSPILVSSFDKIVSPEKLALMRVLEINITRLPHTYDLYYNSSDPGLGAVMFPSLLQLRFLVGCVDSEARSRWKSVELSALTRKLVGPETDVIVF